MNEIIENELVMEAELALAEEPLIVTTLGMLPARLVSTVKAALVVAYAHGYVAQQMDRVQGSTH